MPPPPSVRGERASIDLVGALLLVASFAGAILTGFRLTSGVLATNYAAFDSKDAASLRCAHPLSTLLDQGAKPVFIASWDGPLSKPCLPPRTDHAAPGRKRDLLPEAICALVARTDRKDLQLMGLRCALH